MRKNQPLATETMEFQMRPMAEKGSSNWMSRCQREKRLMVQASISSLGMLLSEL